MKRPPKYNPGFLGDREIEDLFCVRTRELEILIRTLKENKADINRHLLVIGPRGSGKTTLLRQLTAKIREIPELDAAWHPVMFMEENYEILTLNDLWREALYYASGTVATTGAAIGQLQNCAGKVYENYKTLKTPPGGSQNPYIGDIALANLLEFADRCGKRLLLICENLNALFSVLSDREAWKLRSVLQTEKRIMFLGSATARFDQIDHQKKALYDFFKIVPLERLTTEDCAKLWLTVSGKQPAASQAEALRILSGGLPRFLAMLAWFGRDLTFSELMENLEELIDDHTDYFRGMLEALPPTERKVYVSLARLWANSPVGIIADEAGMEQPATSAALSRLVKRGLVEEYAEEDGRAPVKRGKTYQLTERLFNIFYLMRRGGPEALLVRDVVNFLARAFSPEVADSPRKLCDIDVRKGVPGAVEAALSDLGERLRHPAEVQCCMPQVTDRCLELASISPETARRTVETIEGSASRNVFYPLAAGIRLHLGEKMRLPLEVRDIAWILRRKIQDVQVNR